MTMKNIFQFSLIASVAMMVGIAGTFMVMSDSSQTSDVQTLDEQQEPSPVPTPVNADRTSMLYSEVTPQMAAEQAAYGLIGTITKLQPIQVDIDGRTYVHTIVSMMVIEDLFGNYPLPTIQFRIEGGEYDEHTMDVEDPMSFSKNENVMVFIGIGDEGGFPFGAEHYLIGGPQAVFVYDEDADNINSKLHKSFDREDVKDAAKAYYGEK